MEILSDKTGQTYQELLAKHGVAPEEFVMVGNSLRSDVLPVVALGGWGVYIPYAVTWAHEESDEAPAYPEHFFELEHLGQLPALIKEIEKNGP